MGLFNRRKSNANIVRREQRKRAKLLVNVRDKKFRQYLDGQFNSALKKEEFEKVISEMQWSALKERIDNMPRRLKVKLLLYMSKNLDKFTLDVQANFLRYMQERQGISIEK